MTGYRHPVVDGQTRDIDSGLKGRLTEVYFAALSSSQAAPLANRLGERATVIDPLFGRASGKVAVAAQLDAMSHWLAVRDASFERFAFVPGSDREVTEGWLLLTVEGERIRLPVAVVVEKRREREVEVRSYYSTARVRSGPVPPASPLVGGDPLSLPPPVAAHVEALVRGDVDAVVASFELGGTVRGPEGVTHAKLHGGGPLRGYYARLLAGGGVGIREHGRVDDGSTSVLEYTVVRIHGRDVAPQSGLAVYERGESGLLRTVRGYDDVSV